MQWKVDKLDRTNIRTSSHHINYKREKKGKCEVEEGGKKEQKEERKVRIDYDNAFRGNERITKNKRIEKIVRRNLKDEEIMKGVGCGGKYRKKDE